MSSFVTVRDLPPFHPYKSRVVYSEIEVVASHDDIRHGALRACLAHVGIDDGVEVFHQADVPARSGTGSSSTFVVGLLNALYAMRGVFRTPAQLAAEAIRIEQDVLKENVGCQDQVWASHGGIGQIRFHPDGTYTFVPLALSPAHQRDLEAHLLLYFTNIPRTSSDVAATYYGKLTDTADRHHALVRLAEEATEAIRKADYQGLGRCIDSSWRLKAMMSPAVCPPVISELYMKARIAGAWGGKLMGAGGGGTFACIAPPEKHAAVDEIFRQARCVKLPAKFSPVGSSVVFADRTLGCGAC